MAALRRILAHDKTFAFAGLAFAFAIAGAIAFLVLSGVTRLGNEETEETARRWASTIAQDGAGFLAGNRPDEASSRLLAGTLAADEAEIIRIRDSAGRIVHQVPADAPPAPAIPLTEALLAGTPTAHADGATTIALAPIRDRAGKVVGTAEIVADGAARKARYARWATTLLSTIVAIVLGSLLVLVLALFSRAREKKQADDRLSHLAHHDALTDLPNRDMIHSALEREIARHAADGRQFALHLVDIDHFKEINETFGGAAADTVLRTVADRLAKLATDPGHIARLGSDEFAIIQPEAGGARHAEIFASRIAAVVGETIATGEHNVTPTASIGIALAPDHASDVRRLVTAADAALSAVKASGGNDVRFFRPSMERSSALRFELRGELREAFDKRWFEIAYQPQYDLKDRRLVGFEALMRLRHPRRGFVSPAEFLPVADELGLVSALNDWIIKEACRAARDWPEGMGVTVNLSAAQFKKKNGGQRILELCQEAYCPTSRLALDLTETILDLPGERVTDELRRLKDAGVLLLLDDFGVGTSSVTNLYRFGFDGFKLDGDLVRGLGVEPSAATIVKALIQLGRSLDMVVMAEGVETVEQAGFLVQNGCSLVQGFLFGRPVPLSDVDGMIARGTTRAEAA